MKDAFYFPHDSNAADDPKIMMLISQLQLEGYGLYWIVIEHLRQQPDFKSVLAILPALAMRYGSTKEKIMTVVQGFDLFTVDNESFWSESLISRMQPWLARKEAGRLAGIKSGKQRRLKVGSTKVEGSLNDARTKKRKEKKGKERGNATPAGAASKSPSSNDSISFEESFTMFWDYYHKITGKPKTDRAAALKWWKSKQMNLDERRKAYMHVKSYFKWAMDEYGDIQFVKKCRTYLADRAWQNEYDNDKPKDPTKTMMR